MENNKDELKYEEYEQSLRPQYLKEYIGECYEIAESSEKIYIGKEFRRNSHLNFSYACIWKFN